MDIVLMPLFKITLMILGLLRWSLVVYAVFSWLMAFGILNTTNQAIFAIMDFLRRIIHPLLEPIRRIIPPLGGLDLSFMALFFAIYFVEMVIGQMMIRMAVV